MGTAAFMDEARRFPALAEFLTVTQVDGQKREPASLILFVEDGWPKICLSDRQLGRVCFHTDQTFLGCLEGLEANLEAGQVDWRAKRGKK